MGTVYRASDTATGEIVAVKALAPIYSFDEHFRARFEAEIDTLIALDHPHIVRIHSYGQEDGNLYFAMELVEGCSLFQKLKSGHAFHWHEVLEISRHVASGLRHAHDRGIVHRDLKPGNLLLSTDNVVKITDFGIAKTFGGPQMTGEGNIVGTMDFMAPEQALGRPATAKSDLYSLGIVIYTLLSGRTPLSAQSVEETFENLKRKKIPRLDSVVPDVPTRFADLVHYLLERAPEDRISTALALIKQIDILLEELKSISEAKTSIVAESGSAESIAQPIVPAEVTVKSTPHRSQSPRVPGIKSNVSVKTNPPAEKSRQLNQPQSSKPAGHFPKGEVPADQPAVSAVDRSASLSARSTALSPKQQEREFAAAVTRSDYFNPVTDDLRQRQADDTSYERPPTRIWPVAVLLCLALIMLSVGFYYAVIRKPSPEALLTSIDADSDRLHRVRDEINQFIELYPEHDRHDEVVRLQKILSASIYSRTLEQRSRSRRTVIQTKYLEIINEYESDRPMAIAYLSDFVTLHESLDLEDVDRECVDQARGYILKLEREHEKVIGAKRAALSEAIKKADEIMNDRPAEAIRILESAIRFHSGQTDVDDLLDRARQSIDTIQHRRNQVP